MPAVMTTISSDRVNRARNGLMVRGASAWPMRMLAATSTLSAPLTFRNRLMVRGAGADQPLHHPQVVEHGEDAGHEDDGRQHREREDQALGPRRVGQGAEDEGGPGAGAGHQVHHPQTQRVEGGAHQVAAQRPQQHQPGHGPVHPPPGPAAGAVQEGRDGQEPRHHPPGAPGKGQERQEPGQFAALEHDQREQPLQRQGPGHRAPIDGLAVPGKGPAQGHEHKNAQQSHATIHGISILKFFLMGMAPGTTVPSSNVPAPSPFQTGPGRGSRRAASPAPGRSVPWPPS